ncbi:tyrosine-type recombinase/integrase [Thalassospira lucentensis]|uniref:tyrosine-type recombinase/integrase n=1 Tax=Thalassospira lucentensis TaxID=168935 RepID=UPI003AA9CECC
MWEITWREDGHSRRKSTSTKDFKEAKAALDAFVRKKFGVEVEQISEAPVFQRPAVADVSVSVDQVLDLYLERYVPEEQALSTQETTKYNVKAIRGFFGKFHAESLDKEHCKAYVTHRKLQRGGTISRFTLDRELAVFQGALNFAQDEGLILHAPVLPAFPKSKKRKKPNYLTAAEYHSLLESCHQRHLRTFVMLGAATGARPQALLELSWRQLDFARETIYLLDKDEIETGKGKATVKVLDQHFWAELRTLYEEQKESAHDLGRGAQYLIEYRGRPVKCIKKAFATAVDRAGLSGRDITPKTLRHTHASWLVQAGVSLYEVSERLGHEGIRMVEQHYGHLHPDYQAKSANVIKGLMNLAAKRPQNGPTAVDDASESAGKEGAEKTKSQGFPWLLGMVEPIRIELTTSTMPL